MTTTDEQLRINVQSTPEINLTEPTDRRQDIEAKHLQLTALLNQIDCEGLLFLEPANFAWLTSGGKVRGVFDDNAAPALYYSPEGRWIICSNVDTQRIFDEEVDGLGFQLKEWPWHLGREALLTDLCNGRKIACDRPIRSGVSLAPKLLRMRLKLTDYDQACYRALGQVLGHALEATCRNIARGDTEREVAGHLSHRLIHRGAQPLRLSVVADGLTMQYRQAGYTPRQVKKSAVLIASAQKYGLCATASRTVVFGEPAPVVKKSHDSACRVSATYIASSWPDAVAKQIYATTQRVYKFIGAEHEWLRCPQGHITGRTVVESPLLPKSDELLQANWAVTWFGSVGPALCCDTYLITEDGPRTLTSAENWPLKRIRVQGADFVRPDLLIR